MENTLKPESGNWTNAFRKTIGLLLFVFIFTLVQGQQQAKAPRLSDPKSFTWVVLPDPQTYTKFGRNQPLFDLMTAWIKDQQKNLNIQMVLCEGDLVEQNNITAVDSINGDQTSNQQWQSVSASSAAA